MATQQHQENLVLGLDVGYSNACFAVGDTSGPMVTDVMPAGAGPVSLLPERISDDRTPNGYLVDIDGETWVAGVEPASLQGWSRDLHHDYPSTRTWRALFQAMLSRVDAPRIERLVTGLPVEHYQDKERVTRLARKLRGEHTVRNGRTTVIEDVMILPQPAGAYLDYVSTAEELGVAEHGRVLVVDPGYFSYDWVLIEGGEMRTLSSGTSLHAMSAVLAAVDDHLYRTHGGRIGPERIERALRNRDQTVYVSGNPVAVADLMGEAAIEVTRRAVTEMRQALRGESASIDLIVLAGGGASTWMRAVTEAFPSVRIHTTSDAVTANARGFWYAGL